ncbi:hypothetical protein HD554DRAFT_2178829 [Boletus coccyginus]|nr:hypothetical protein HD554DRAFT_2178829 [Boletus coccyginus]
MPSTVISHPSSIPLFTQLIHRLRQTNARYDQIAYQCRHTQRLTYHAKRRAYRVGLRIDTSKAHAEWLDYLSAASTQLLPVLDRSIGSPVGVVTETDSETEGDNSDLQSIAEDACLPNPWPEPEPKRLPHVIAPVTRLSPLGLGLSSIFDDSDPCDLPVPGAPRWRSKPLPEDTEAMTHGSVSFKTSCTYDRGVMATHAVSDSVSKPLDVMYGCLGITLPRRHLKRKMPDVEVDWSTVFSRRPKVGAPDDGHFLGAQMRGVAF